MGFDQGLININLPQTQFLNELRSAINNQQTNINKFYLGFFLQFKKVEKATKRSANIPNHYNTPYYRSKLSLKPNKFTRRSQHETLLLLQPLITRQFFMPVGCCSI